MTPDEMHKWANPWYVRRQVHDTRIALIQLSQRLEAIEKRLEAIEEQLGALGQRTAGLVVYR